MSYKSAFLATLSVFSWGLIESAPANIISTIDDIETQQAIRLVIDKEAFQKNTDVKISIQVINKDPVVVAPSVPQPLTSSIPVSAPVTTNTTNNTIYQK